MQSFRQWAKAGQFWGKVRIDEASGERQAWLPLSQHCIDVAQVFFELVRAPYVHGHLSRLAAVTLTEAQLARLACIAFFHDLGKLALGFQSKVFDRAISTALKGHTAEVLATLFSGAAASARVLAAFPAGQMQGWFTEPQGLSAGLQSAWSHHGQPVCVEAGASVLTQCHDELWQPVEGLDPAVGMAALVQACQQQFPQAFASDVPALHLTVEMQHHLAGLVMLADWLGSNADVFALTGASMTTSQRIAQAQPLARALLRGSLLDGLDQVVAPFQGVDTVVYETLFEGTPRPLQRAIGELDVASPDVRTLVAESDTGSGKTEAALLWWAKLRAAGKVEGLYFALPTRVAARQLYERVVRFIDSTYPEGQRPNVLLAVPGYVRSSAEGRLPLPAADAQHHDDARVTTLGTHWASEQAKRFLAAPIVVGTIDQALLSTLQTNHAHLRATLLQRHLLVVDEVHSSDAYMRQLLKDLLQRRRTAGSYSLMLSATLGCEARQDLLARATTVSYSDAMATPYPRLSGENNFAVNVSAKDARQKLVRVTPLPLLGNPSSVARRVAQAIHQGARVLVIANTVKRACALQLAIESELGADNAALFRVNGLACPHHGRYLAADREVLDAEVGKFLGKGSAGGAKVLVGTQTLEQSLDIDADVLFTDLCPMDVLLQRIGRLWRHERNDRPAPWSLNGQAQCFLLVPEQSLEASLDDTKLLRELGRAGLGTVYSDLRILDLTWRYFVETTPDVQVPTDNRTLVEATVHSDRLGAYRGAGWNVASEKVWGERVLQVGHAKHVSALPVYQQEFGDPLCRFSTDVHAATRLGDSTALLRLAQLVRTPFGVTVSEIQVPGQDLRRQGETVPLAGLKKEAELRTATATGFEVHWEGLAWSYDRLGLRKAAA